jgi:diphosphomevalonate decarboxylase
MKPISSTSKSIVKNNSKSIPMPTVQWSSPSNIAIIKYWGKHGIQLPRNPSISFTLQNAKTTTSISAHANDHGKQVSLSFLFEGNENPAFQSKIEKFLGSIVDPHFPFLKGVHLDIASSNTFPHSSGIASSASAMSAIAMCLCDLEQQYIDTNVSMEDMYRKASIISRLGSGSACRSVFSTMGLWGYHPEVVGSNDDYAIDMSSEVHEVYRDFHDDILIISADEKSVSSTAGHGLMIGNPYADVRYQQASNRLGRLMDVLGSGDVSAFGKIAEDEALTLHALMMCSDPSYILMREGTLTVINLVRAFRQETGVPLYFTLDAGPNVHLLYPHAYQEKAQSFIHNELKAYCHQGRIIEDVVGRGPEKLQ